ncbi:uncharacterized protein LOC126323905 [Schistocerca gregaria]|uniref:uncharacterized protein LOC126323905 n=1 Tax=Schistocerca gregaria TaxID=7010 RepID=UPI00211F0C97|nr:uncharacterized protein LOC126323905 [Schistocerca gregaria]
MERPTTGSVCSAEIDSCQDSVSLPNTTACSKKKLCTKHFSDQEFALRFRIDDKIGSGGFGCIYKAYDFQERRDVAIKIENRNGKSYLDREVGFYRAIQDYNRGILKTSPRCYLFSTKGGSNFAVFDLMGPSLADLFHTCRRKFSLKCVLMLAEQLLTILENIHKLGFVHGDVKPGNFVMGTGTNTNSVYVIDFGLSNFWRNKRGEHIPLNFGRNFRGTYRYASTNSHLNIETSRRDDLEALAYVLIYFLKGSLPWQNLKLSTDKRRILIGTFKSKISIEKLTSGIPSEFSFFLSYVKKLGFSEEPDYIYCRNLFRRCLERHAFTFDYTYDWLSLKDIHTYNRRRKRSEVADQNLKVSKTSASASIQQQNKVNDQVVNRLCQSGTNRNSPSQQNTSPSLISSVFHSLKIHRCSQPSNVAPTHDKQLLCNNESGPIICPKKVDNSNPSPPTFHVAEKVADCSQEKERADALIAFSLPSVYPYLVPSAVQINGNSNLSPVSRRHLSTSSHMPPPQFLYHVVEPSPSRLSMQNLSIPSAMGCNLPSAIVNLNEENRPSPNSSISFYPFFIHPTLPVAFDTKAGIGTSLITFANNTNDQMNCNFYHLSPTILPTYVDEPLEHGIERQQPLISKPCKHHQLIEIHDPNLQT